MLLQMATLWEGERTTAASRRTVAAGRLWSRAVETVEDTERMNNRRPHATDTTNHLVARVPVEGPTPSVNVHSNSPSRVRRASSRSVRGESLSVVLSVGPSGSLAEFEDPGAETGHEHKNAGGSGQEEARACVRADVGADDLFDDDVHMFIVLAPSFGFYWGCPGADPENPEIVSGAIRAGNPGLLGSHRR
jgi:hypothetical protein